MALVNWFNASEDYFWSWDSEGYACVNQGHTILHALELLRLMELQLSFNGPMPSLGTLLLCLHALNDSWESDKELVFEKLLGDHQFSEEENLQAINFLKTLASLRHNPDSKDFKDQLFVLISNAAHRKYKSSKLKKALKNFSPEKLAELEKTPGNHSKFEDLRNLALLNNIFPNTEVLVKELRELPEIKPGEILHFEKKEKFDKKGSVISEELLPFLRNSDTFQVAAIVPFLSGGLNHHSRKFQLGDPSVGGVSDISQKGNPDRLLSSEFAYDIDTFLNRIANKEALYYHPEMPKSKREFVRTFLIDSSLPAWGNPRLLAFAIALSMELDPKKLAKHEYYSLGNTVLEFFPQHPIGLSEGLNDLSLNLSPITLLETWAQKYKPQEGNDVYLFLEISQVKSSEFNEFLIRNKGKINYLCLCGADGSFQRYRLNQTGRHLEQELRINFNFEWKTIQAQLKKISKKEEIEDQFPLLIFPFSEPWFISSLPNQTIWMQANDGLLLTSLETSSQESQKLQTDNPNHPQNGWLIQQFNNPAKKAWKAVLGPMEERICMIALHPHKGLIALLNHPEKLEYSIYEFETKKRFGKNPGYWNSKEFSVWYKEECFFVKTYSEIYRFELNGDYIQNHLEEGFQIPKNSQQITIPFFNLKQSRFYKVKSVYINSLGKLCFDKFELHINNSGQLLLKENPENSVHTLAQGNYQNGFVFKKKYEVNWLPGNQVSLSWPNTSENKIIFPLIPDYPLAAWSMGKSCGNPYFIKDGTILENRKFYDLFIQPWIDEIFQEKPIEFNETIPEYIGGMEAFTRDFNKEFKLPIWDRILQSSGRVVIKFEISKTGNIRNARIESGISPQIDAEALRAFLACRYWQPGKQNGVPVDVTLTLPLRINP